MAEFTIELSDWEVFDSERFSRAMVDAVTDVPTLVEWYQALVDKADEISEFAKAFRLTECYDEAYFERSGGKLAYCRIAKTWVERRIITLGGTVPYPPNDTRSKQLTILQEKVKKLTAELARAQVPA